ncbi:hypothetical protein AAE02nite_10270 [Adhaeribacter aerolatus]|uniref:Uncharacterized protein n=1 Tax=Adhaeribacter aerolatus TaxID=670289 RepID=A0A512AUL2_9BACT|nr:hypothetical protein [Adhaeribacter aerolatus]GEO03363.1 hypothetical protein AAE02nite_10270 [Adhaeribacter aerolatus]
MKLLKFMILFFLITLKSLTVLGQKTINIHFDEYGKVKKKSAFYLKKEKEYKFILRIDNPSEQHNNFNKYLQQKFNNTYKNLSDETNPLVALYAYLWGDDYEVIKSDMKEISDILSKSDAEATLTATPTDFKYLHSKFFLKNNLFGNIFTVKAEPGLSGVPIKPHPSRRKDESKSPRIKEEGDAEKVAEEVIKVNAKPEHTGVPVKPELTWGPKSSPYNKPMYLETPSFKINDEYELKLLSANLKEQFIQSFYSEGLKNDIIIRSVKPGVFYNKDIPSFLGLAKSLEELKKLIEKEDTYVCDEILINNYEEIKSHFDNSNIIKVLKSNWVKQWIWVNEGMLTINPFGFTDEDKLNLPRSFDEEGAKKYDAYRENSIKLLINSNTINEGQVDHTKFDSLLNQSGEGRMVFTKRYKDKVETLKKKNTNSATDQQKVFSTISVLRFPSLERKKSKTAFRMYDASNKLKADSSNFTETIGNNVQVKVVAYNLKPNEKFVLSENPKEIKDESTTIAKINEAGDALAGVAGLTAGLPSALLTLAQLVVPKPTDKVPPFNIAIGEQSHKNLSNKGLIGNKTLMIEKDAANLKIIDDKNKQIQEQLKISFSIDNYINDLGLDSCPSLRNALIKEITNSNNRALLFENLGDGLNYFQSRIDAIIKPVILKYNKELILYNINNQLAVIEFIKNQESFLLPPVKIDAKTDTTAKHRNLVVDIAPVEKATRKDIQLSVVDLKSSKVISSKKDAYKTAPTHWVAGSIGLAYVLNPFSRNAATISNGIISNTRDEEQLRLIAGLNFYPIPIIMADDRPVWKMPFNQKMLSRISIFGGLSFPKPLYNLHTGLGIDIVPGVKIGHGFHFYRFTNYTLLNNEIINEKSNYVYNGSYFNFSLEPTAVVKFLGLVK